MIGPVFFILLETSIRKGVRAALSFDLGVLISDLIYILIAYVFFSEVQNLTQGENEGYLKLLGGLLFLTYGVLTFMKTPKEHSEKDLGKSSNQTKQYLMLFLKGLILNMANPMVIFYWFSVMALGAKDDTEMSFSTQMIIYIGVLLTTFFSMDILKIIGAKKLRPFINNQVLKSLNRITGGILFAFGIVLFLQGLIAKM
jgi:threonine/homoserine/homoserine lactone efflux protein